VVSAEAERPRNKVRRLTVANRSTLRCAKTSRHAAKRSDKIPPWTADVASPLPMTERSTRRTRLRRNLPVASSTYARDTARPGRQGVRSKIFAIQKVLDRRRPDGSCTSVSRCLRQVRFSSNCRHASGTSICAAKGHERTHAAQIKIAKTAAILIVASPKSS